MHAASQGQLFFFPEDGFWAWHPASFQRPVHSQGLCHLYVFLFNRIFEQISSRQNHRGTGAYYHKWLPYFCIWGTNDPSSNILGCLGYQAFEPPPSIILGILGASKAAWILACPGCSCELSWDSADGHAESYPDTQRYPGRHESSICSDGFSMKSTCYPALGVLVLCKPPHGRLLPSAASPHAELVVGMLRPGSAKKLMEFLKDLQGHASVN